MFLLKDKNALIKEINDLGKKANPQFICIDPVHKKKNGHRYCLVECVFSKKRKVVKFSNLKSFNPFSRGDIADEIVKQKITNIGLASKYPFQGICSNSNPKASKRYVKVKSVKSGVVKEVLYHSIMEGKNPFNETQNRLEVEVVQPMYEKLLKKYKLEYVKEYRLGKKQLDFMFIKNNKRYGLEVKQSDKWHSAKNQLEGYRKLCKLRQYGLDSIVLSDPKGSHKSKGAISIKEFETLLKSR